MSSHSIFSRIRLAIDAKDISSSNPAGRDSEEADAVGFFTYQDSCREDRVRYAAVDRSLSWPSVGYVWSRRHVVRDDLGGVRVWSGWMDVSSGREVSSSDVMRSVAEGKEQEKDLVESMKKWSRISRLKNKGKDSNSEMDCFYQCASFILDGGSGFDLLPLFSLLRDKGSDPAFCASSFPEDGQEVFFKVCDGRPFKASQGLYSCDALYVFSAKSGFFFGEVESQEASADFFYIHDFCFFKDKGVWRDEIPGWSFMAREFCLRNGLSLDLVLNYGSRYFGDQSVPLDVVVPVSVFAERFPSMGARCSFSVSEREPEIAPEDLDLSVFLEGFDEEDRSSARSLLSEADSLDSVRSHSSGVFSAYDEWMKWAEKNVFYCVKKKKDDDFLWKPFDPFFLFSNGI